MLKYWSNRLILLLKFSKERATKMMSWLESSLMLRKLLIILAFIILSLSEYSFNLSMRSIFSRMRLLARFVLYLEYFSVSFL